MTATTHITLGRRYLLHAARADGGWYATVHDLAERKDKMDSRWAGRFFADDMAALRWATAYANALARPATTEVF
jgi:hypothetical protein